MGIEIEKKYPLTAEERRLLELRLSEIGAAARGKVFEENLLFGGAGLDHVERVLRLRRAGGRSTLTLKERLENSDSVVRRRREVETEVDNPEALMAILGTTGGYKPALVYEKYRTTWEVAGTKVTLDELPFGVYLEIEGPDEAIAHVEGLLNVAGLTTEPLSYPELVLKHGVRNNDGTTETRFEGAQS